VVRVKASIGVDRPPAVVWDLIGDPRRLVDWDPGVKRVELAGPVEVGVRFTITAEFLGRDRTSTGQITVFEQGHRIGWHVDPPGSRRLWADSWLGAIYTVEPEASGHSLVTREFQAVGRGLLGRLVEPLIAREARRARLEEVASIKRAAEA
jgi:carbon monoxide dehydrogenase subunit G